MRGKHGRGTERRPDAWAPDQAEQHADTSLADQAEALQARLPAAGPAGEWRRYTREQVLRLRYQQQGTDREQDDGARLAHDLAVEPGGGTQHRDREADQGERRDQPERERERAPSVALGGAADHDRHQRQYAR